MHIQPSIREQRRDRPTRDGCCRSNRHQSSVFGGTLDPRCVPLVGLFAKAEREIWGHRKTCADHHRTRQPFAERGGGAWPCGEECAGRGRVERPYSRWRPHCPGNARLSGSRAMSVRYTLQCVCCACALLRSLLVETSIHYTITSTGLLIPTRVAISLGVSSTILLALDLSSGPLCCLYFRHGLIHALVLTL